MRSVTCAGLDKPWSVITLGCWQIAPSVGWGNHCTPENADGVVKAALDQGITAFDTAEGYGDGESERRLGKALGAKKDAALIISKIWPNAELTLQSYTDHLNQTLRALDRDYVDVYLMHFPQDHFDTTEKSSRLCDLMGVLKESGKATLVGLSNFKAGDLSLLGEGLSQFSVNQVPYSLLDLRYEGETREICKQADIPYMAFAATAKGLLSGKTFSDAEMTPARKDHAIFQEPLFSGSSKVVRVIKEIAEETGRLPIQVALSWVLAQENILTAIVGSAKPAQVPEFAPAGDLMLNKHQLAKLTRAADNFHKLRSKA